MQLCDDALNEIINFSDIETFCKLKCTNKKFNKLIENINFYCVIYHHPSAVYPMTTNPIIIRGHHNNHQYNNYFEVKISIKINAKNISFKNKNLCKIKNEYLYYNYYLCESISFNNLQLVEVPDVEINNNWNLEFKYDDICSRYKSK